MQLSLARSSFYALGGNHTQARCHQSWAACSPCSAGEKRACQLYCDRAYCDSLHLNDAGYRTLAEAVRLDMHARAVRGGALGRGRWAGRGRTGSAPDSLARPRTDPPSTAK